MFPEAVSRGLSDRLVMSPNLFGWKDPPEFCSYSVVAFHKNKVAHNRSTRQLVFFANVQIRALGLGGGRGQNLFFPSVRSTRFSKAQRLRTL